MKIIKRGDKYHGTPGEVVNIQVSKYKFITVVLTEFDYLKPCTGCPLRWQCTDYLSAGCCIPVEDIVE